MTPITTMGPIALTAEAIEAEVRKTGKPVRVVKTFDDIPAVLAAAARPNDLVVTLGAGSIGTMPDRILKALAMRSGGRPAEAGDSEGAGDVE